MEPRVGMAAFYRELLRVENGKIAEEIGL